jgi:methylglutaconyl-CoA hydratase
MTDSPLLVSSQGQLMTLTLNRPERCNALDGPLIQALQEAFFEAGRQDKIRTVVLKGAGKHFCAGADLEWMQKLAQSSFELGRDDARNLASLLYMMYSFPKPIITLVQGSAIGGGLGLLACSDLIIASEQAHFCFSEVKIGLVPAVISPYIISMVGQHVARYYFLTAERFSAPEALRIGLIQKMVAEEALEKTGEILAQTLLQNAPAAMAEVKHLLPQVANQEISLELSEKTAEIFARLRVSEEAQEGLKAFMEKRSPNW